MLGWDPDAVVLGVYSITLLVIVGIAAVWWLS